jgi:Protein of unknown function (DUF2281).
MTKEAIIQKIIEILEKLPSEKINEVSDFADFILKKYEEQLIQKGMEKNSLRVRSLFHFYRKRRTYMGKKT